MKALFIIPFLFFLFLVYAICRAAKRPYTDEEWDEQLKSDFEKYGPVPDPPPAPSQEGNSEQPTTSNQ